MAKIFLTAYVAINMIIIIVNLIMNVFSGETIHLLSSDDWLFFIVGCGALAICEVLEKKSAQ